MNYNIQPSTKIYTIDDAIKLSKKRLPKLVFDFIDGEVLLYGMKCPELVDHIQ